MKKKKKSEEESTEIDANDPKLLNWESDSEACINYNGKEPEHVKTNRKDCFPCEAK